MAAWGLWWLFCNYSRRLGQVVETDICKTKLSDSWCLPEDLSVQSELCPSVSTHNNCCLPLPGWRVQMLLPPSVLLPSNLIAWGSTHIEWISGKKGLARMKWSLGKSGLAIGWAGIVLRNYDCMKQPQHCDWHNNKICSDNLDVCSILFTCMCLVLVTMPWNCWHKRPSKYHTVVCSQVLELCILGHYELFHVWGNGSAIFSKILALIRWLNPTRVEGKEFTGAAWFFLRCSRDLPILSQSYNLWWLLLGIWKGLFCNVDRIMITCSLSFLCGMLPSSLPSCLSDQQA